MGFWRSDLARECCVQGDISGVVMRTREVEGHEILCVHIKTEGAARATGKPCGHYVTVACPSPMQTLLEGSAVTARIVGVELREMAQRMTGKRITPAFTVLAVGLGNADMTPDALGPATVRRLPVTRNGESVALCAAGALCRIAAFSPGVTAATGLKTSELTRGAADAVKPDLVLVIDALAARETAHLGATVQLADTGILPGAGIGRGTEALNADTLGVPVLSLGVPTAVGSETLVGDALLRFGVDRDTAEFADLVHNGKSFFVTPAEIDLLVPLFADLLAEAIGRAFST